MRILDHITIQRKIKRIAIQILENNYGEDKLFLLGINNNGMRLAKLIHQEIVENTESEVIISSIQIDPKNPLKTPISIDHDLKDLNKKAIILVDDVANTGRTIFYAFKPLLDIKPKKVEVAVMVNRKHKSYPINVDYIGLSLATTLQENIKVILEGEEMEAVLD